MTFVALVLAPAGPSLQNRFVSLQLGPFLDYAATMVLLASTLRSSSAELFTVFDRCVAADLGAAFELLTFGGRWTKKGERAPSASFAKH